MMDCWETVRTVGVNQIRRLETCCEVNVQQVQGNLQSLCFFAGWSVVPVFGANGKVLCMGLSFSLLHNLG